MSNYSAGPAHGKLVKEGMASARAEGKRLGKPRRYAPDDPILLLSIKHVIGGNIPIRRAAKSLGISLRTMYRYIYGK